MRLGRYAAGVVLGAAMLLPAAGQGAQKGLTVKPQDGGEPVLRYEGHHALVIAVADYQKGWPSLSPVTAETGKVAKALRQQGFDTERVVNPDADKLAEAVEAFINDHGYARDNRLVIFFSGHGYTTGEDARRKGYLVPADAPDPRQHPVDFKRKALPMSQITAWARQMEARHALFLFDSCFSGTVFKARALPDAPPRIKALTGRPVRQFITAGRADEKVPARSAFAPAFVDALRHGTGDLNGDGYVTGTERGLHLQDIVPRTTRPARHPQYGKIRDYHLSRGDFVFAVGRDRKDRATKGDKPERTKLSPETVFWNSIKNSDDPALFRAYLAKVESGDFSGTFAPLARTKLQKLKGETEVASRPSASDAGPAWAIAERDAPYVVTTRSNIREGPGTDHAKVDLLEPGTEVTVTGTVQDKPWYRVAHAGREAFIHRDLVTPEANYEANTSKADRQDAGQTPEPREASPGFATQPSARNLEPGDTFRDCQGNKVATAGRPPSGLFCGPKMTVVPSGSFRMGSPPSEKGRYDDEGPVHEVTIAEPFAVGVYEVTWAQWEACVEAGGCSHEPDDEGWGRGDRPVVNVSWEDAREYVDWLSGETGEDYRLLTEAEWEYVARAGTRTRYWWGDGIGDGKAVCDGCGSRWDNEKTAPVGSFSANPWGLHDVHGNVWEWTRDCWHDGYDGAPTDGGAWLEGDGGDCSRRLLRGGSWISYPRGLRSANRYRNTAGYRINIFGFRVARTL